MTTVLLAGGGTGGHIYPNIGIAERLERLGVAVTPHFLISDRPGDARIVDGQGGAATTVPVRPLPRRPWQLPGFVTSWRRSVVEVERLLEHAQVGAVVTTGGFVSGPAIVAARRAGVPTALVNLDAVPGIANRYLVRYADDVFTTYPSPRLPDAVRIGLPLRAASTSSLRPEEARQRLGLDPALYTLFATGATHGARSMIAALETLVRSAAAQELLTGWQVLHQCGSHDPAALQASYDAAGVPAAVVDYCDEMGTAWVAADLAIARAGAGTVAEVWANATPTVFLPNPHHPDQRLGRNAQPLVEAGGARIVTDHMDPEPTADGLLEVLTDLLKDDERRMAMREALERTRPDAGADALVDWIDRHLEHGVRAPTHQQRGADDHGTR